MFVPNVVVWKVGVMPASLATADSVLGAYVPPITPTDVAGEAVFAFFAYSAYRVPRTSVVTFRPAPLTVYTPRG
jgi:hypothetical protein